MKTIGSKIRNWNLYLSRVGLVFIWVLISNFIYSQPNNGNFKVQFGPDIRLNKKTVIDEIIGKDSEGIYAITINNSKVILKYFSKDFKRKQENEVRLTLLKKDLVYGGVIEMNGGIYLFSTYINRKEKTTSLYSQKVNKQSLTLSTPKLLGSSSYQGFSSSKSASFEFKISQNHQFLLFVTNLPIKKENDSRFGFLVLDREMNEVWRNAEIIENDIDSTFFRMDTQIDNEGNVYLLSKTQAISKGNGRNEIDYTFKMMQFKPEDKPQYNEFDVEIIGQHVTDISFEILNNNQIQVIGFFSSDGFGQNGVFTLLYDHDFNVINEFSQEFPTDFILQYESEKERKIVRKKEAKGKGVELYSYNIKHLIENQDFTVTLVAEQYYEYVNSFTDAEGHVKNTRHYVYGNIVVVKFDVEGKVDWMELVPKDQNTTDRGYYSSYALSHLSNSTLAFVFNDNPKNRFANPYNDYQTWTNSKKNTEVVLFTITIDGRMDRNVIFKGMYEEVMSRPKVSVQMDENEIIILGEAMRVAKFFKLTFED